MEKKDNVIILKNDAVGDLVQSLSAINNIIKNNEGKNIKIYLSERSKDFDFLVNKKNIEFKIINYDLSIKDKINLLIDFLRINISNIYILTPKNYYFFLPLIFKKIKFYGLCINGPNNYKRPKKFFRKYLYKYQINDRGVLIVNGSQGDAIWREDGDEMVEINVKGEWSGGSVDAEWNPINADETEQEEADS